MSIGKPVRKLMKQKALCLREIEMYKSTPRKKSTVDPTLFEWFSLNMREAILDILRGDFLSSQWIASHSEHDIDYWLTEDSLTRYGLHLMEISHKFS